VVVGSRLPGSGFTRVLESLLAPLARHAEVHWVGIGYKGPARVIDGYRLYPCNLDGGDVFGAFQAARMARERQAAVVVLNDLWMLTAYVPALLEVSPELPVIAYCPLDGGIRDDSYCRAIQGFDAIVTYTAFGREQLAASYDRLATRGELSHRPLIEVIGHGLDSQVFRALPESERGIWRSRLFGDRSLPHEAVLILNANRPTPRKRIDITMAGFARAAARVDRPLYLCLHHALATGEDRFKTQSLIDELGIGERILRTRGALDEEALNGLYNVCPIGLNTSMGEGWGLISFEHAATAAAQIVPRHSACAELWEDAALLVSPTRRYIPECSPLEMAEVGMEDVAVAIEKLVSDTDLRAQVAAAGRRRAADERFRWEALAAQWGRLIERIMANRRTRERVNDG